MAVLCDEGLGGHLDRLYHTYGRAYRHTDPVAFPRRFEDAADREIVAFLAAALSYGRVSHIQASVERLLAVLGDRPAESVRSFDPVAGRRALAGFVHRFNDARDVGLLLHLTAQMLRRAGSIQAFFAAGDDPSTPDIGPGLSSFVERALALDCSAWYRSGRLPRSAGVRFFFPSPADGSACKRLAMFLRWMVRPEDGIDFGLWRGISPSRLVIPLDTHLSRISGFLGLTQRRSAGWAAALEVTERLRAFDAGDPVRFDFALCRLGMLASFPPRRAGHGCPLCAATAMAAAS